jgi:DinB superfamily
MFEFKPRCCVPRDTAQRLREILLHALASLERMDETEASRKPDDSAWSPKEILGHLVDSAQHNHGRLVQLSLEDGTEFPGDDQNAWVNLQRWNERPWLEILTLWHAYNLHLVWLIEKLPDASLEHRGTVFLSRKTVDLRWIIEHYVTHLEHHLNQIDERTKEAGHA